MALPDAYRLGVGIALFNARGEVFMARRIDTRSEAWQMPQGGMDEGESPLQAAMREMEEEIGTNKAELIAESHDWLSYDLPHELVPQLWGGNFRGQKQKWFAMRFLGTDDDINLETDHPEFLEWKWVPFAQAPDFIVPFKKRLYLDLVAEFSHLI